MGEGRGWIGRIHRRTDVALGYGLRPREAAVVRGMVLGDRSLMPEDLETAFQRSGVTHVLAISGQHVAILAAVIYFALRRFAIPATIRAGLTIGLIWPYILIAGAPPSAIRAGVVASFVLAAPLLGRQVSALHLSSSLPFASVTTPGVTPLLVALFYAGCIPPVLAERAYSIQHKPLWPALLLLWTTIWLVLVASGSM
jgi:predicted membrane metal-binding protein